MMDRLLAVALRAVSLMRPFSREFASWPFESAYADEQPVHEALRFSCTGRRLVLPWSSPLKGSLEYADRTARCLITIAQIARLQSAYS
jgi:hypothetical protein